jgi:hypothetical protein
MDKTEAKIIDFMLESSYAEIMHRTISAYILLALHEIQDSLKVDQKYLANELSKYPVQLHSEVLMKLKDKVFLELLKGSKVKSHLIAVLNNVVKMKSDVCEEIMRQFGLLQDSEKVYMHDKLLSLFDLFQKKIRNAIQAGDYKYIYDKWSKDKD